MIEWIEFKNFKALRSAKLPLSRFTLIVGANGSGKSTALGGIFALEGPIDFARTLTVGSSVHESITIRAKWSEQNNGYIIFRSVDQHAGQAARFEPDGGNKLRREPRLSLSRARLFSLDANAIAHSVHLQPKLELAHTGANLAGVLDRLRDENPERFEALNQELARWIPEFDVEKLFPDGFGALLRSLRTW